MNEKERKEGEQEVEGEREEAAPLQGGKEQTPYQAELERLGRELETKEKEAKENYDRYLRQVAELENFKKRTAREREESIKYAIESLIKDLLPSLDNLERAVEHARGGGDGEPLLQGIEMVLRGLLDVLSRHGVTQISAQGEPFNPERHEAIAQVESTQHEPNTVVEEFQKGYYLLDRLVRPSLVSVAKSPETKEKKSQEEKVEKDHTDD